MDGESLAGLESQKKFCQSLVQKVVAHETFILLSGESGSGRTVVCEQVVNDTDAKMRAVFIPCHKDMQLQRLRELFLQQLLPSSAFDTNLNLADALLKVHIPHNDRILVVVDDVDSVVSSFYNELLALYEQFLGQDRFAFILVGKPLWAEEKIAHHQGKSEIISMQIPPLNMEETMVLARNVFAYHDTMRIYSALSKTLPDILMQARGNISQIINLSEKVMKQPTAQQVLKDKGGKLGAGALKGSKKKSSSVGIFVTAVCIIIVLACLIPIFFGGNFFSSSSDSSANDFKSQTQAQVANDGALVFDGGNRSFNPNDVAIEDGALLPNVPNGIDAQTPDKKTEHSVTLSGDDLDKIEGGVNNSDYPRGVGRPVNNQNAQNAQNAQVIVLRRGDNFNHVNTQGQKSNTQIAALQPQLPNAAEQQQQQQQIAQDSAALAQAAKAKLEADRRQALEAQARAEAEAKAKAEAEAKKQAQRAQAATPRPAPAPAPAPENATRPQEMQRPPLRAGQIINLADEQRQINNRNNRATSNQAAVEGALSEISAKDNNRYTVQIVSASNRNNIRQAASHLNGRFWILETSRNGRPWYILIAGDYASREEASNAARNIPRAVSQGATPFAKRFLDVKNEMRR